MANYEEEIVEETIETPEEDVDVEEVEDIDTEPEEEAVDWEARAKKAEAAIIKAKSKPKAEKVDAPRTDSKMSIFDQKAIFNADIDTQEDLDEIMDYADRKGISVADALQSTVIKATLAENAQIRKSAQAVNTGTGRRAGGAVSDDRLMSDAKKGIMPSSEEDIAKLARMRVGKK
tara:strand:- start:2440 stop:2964 length:525 start_codon:yes stop_codon:yes gene_type:complete